MDGDEFYAQGRFISNGVYRLLIDKNTVGSASHSCKIDGTGQVVCCWGHRAGEWPCFRW